MVGGSVNGRPFRDDANSYLKTGLPCGNPQRFRSRAVMHMIPVPNGILEDQCLDVPPVQKTETEGERQFKRILDKQLNKEMTFDELMKQSRNFTKSHDYHSLTEKISGKMALKEFQAVEQKKESCDRLQEFGLSEEEIKLQLDGKNKINPEILQDKLKIIEEKIQAKRTELEKPAQFRDVHYMSRHEMEIESTLKPNSSHVHFLQRLMTTEKPLAADVHPDDPINHLKQMEKEMFGHLRKNKRKRRKLNCNKEASTFSLPQTGVFSEQESQCSADQGSLHLNRTTEKECDHSLNIKNPTEMDMSTYLSFVNSWMTDDEIFKGKITMEQLCSIPRFANYTPGRESKILYIKNLGRNVQLLDLMPLFARFANDQKTFPCIKLLQGRMRGQAFVSFEDAGTARKAMKLVNGFLLKGKPLIISYGKEKTKDI